MVTRCIYGLFCDQWIVSATWENANICSALATYPVKGTGCKWKLCFHDPCRVAKLLLEQCFLWGDSRWSWRPNQLSLHRNWEQNKYFNTVFVLQDNFLFFTGNLKPIREKLLENEIVGHAFLVDSNGLVRWKAHANPTEQEITSMLDCSKLLLKETERTLRRNNKVVSNFRW